MLLRELCDTDMVWVKKVTFAATPICAAILWGSTCLTYFPLVRLPGLNFLRCSSHCSPLYNPPPSPPAAKIKRSFNHKPFPCSSQTQSNKGVGEDILQCSAPWEIQYINWTFLIMRSQQNGQKSNNFKYYVNHLVALNGGAAQLWKPVPAPRSPRQRPTLEVQPASTPRWWLATKKVKKNALSLTNTVTPGFGSNVLLINGIILSKPCRCRVYLGFRSLIAAGKESFLLRPVGSLSIDCSRGEQSEQPAQSTRSHLLYNAHLQLCTQCIRSRCLDQSNSKNLLVCLLEQPIQKVLNRQRRHKKTNQESDVGALQSDSIPRTACCMQVQCLKYIISMIV